MPSREQRTRRTRTAASFSRTTKADGWSSRRSSTSMKRRSSSGNSAAAAVPSTPIGSTPSTPRSFQVQGGLAYFSRPSLRLQLRHEGQTRCVLFQPMLSRLSIGDRRANGKVGKVARPRLETVRAIRPRRSRRQPASRPRHDHPRRPCPARRSCTKSTTAASSRGHHEECFRVPPQYGSRRTPCDDGRRTRFLHSPVAPSATATGKTDTVTTNSGPCR